MVEKLDYYSEVNHIPRNYMVDPVHEAAALSIADDDAGFVAWRNAKNIDRMNAAWKAKVETDWHWTAAPLVDSNGKAGKPKATAVRNWTRQLYATYPQRKQGLLTGQLEWSEALLEFPDSPYPPHEVFLEDEA